MTAMAARERTYLQPLVDTVVRRGVATGRGAVVAFTSAMPKDGVSYVVESLGRELGAAGMQPVLVASSTGVARLSPAKLRANDGVFEAVEPNIVTLRGEELLPFEAAGHRTEDSLEMLRKWFRFILIDCPSLEESSQALGVAPLADGMVLVVSAGRTPRRKIERARKLLLSSPAPLLGCVLNRRTYPVPGFIYDRL
ncbi:MAG: hypothetical protein U0Q16_03580 [Bryobacteraceae bacterium]